MQNRPRVMVIEDNELFAALLAAALEEDFDVETGGNGLQGIARCLEGGIDLVVTDIGMPVLDGLEMIRQFSRDPRLRSIPVIVVTASHFSTINRSDIERFPQVKRVLLKTESVAGLAGEARLVLAESGGGPSSYAGRDPAE